MKDCVTTSLDVNAPNDTITSVNGRIEPTDFSSISSRNQNARFLPNGIGKFFPKLRRLEISRSRLKMISKKYFQDLPYLIAVEFNRNELTTLEGDFFELVSKLKYINFNHNQLNYVDEDLMTNLEDLKEAWFQNNNCVDVWGYSNFKSGFSNLTSVIQQVGEQCSLSEVESQEDLGIEYLKKQNIDQKQAIDTLRLQIDQQRKKTGDIQMGFDMLHEKCVMKVGILKLLKTAGNITMAYDLKILSPGTRMKVKEDDFMWVVKTELFIYQQRTLFLPINLGQLLPFLELLSVTSSNLYEIERSVSKELDLRTLILSSNKLQEIINGTFDDLENLQSLDLSSNSIRRIEPQAFNKLLKMKYLNLGSNLLWKLEIEIFTTITKLETLILKNNLLMIINSNLFSSLSAFQNIDLANNICINFSFSDVGKFG